MCGLIALFHHTPRTAPELPAMLEDLGHRGPDNRAILAWNAPGGTPQNTPYLGEGAADRPAQAHLGHLRLTIIDTSDAGNQPMASPDGRYWITYNGEIYNYVELREELAGLGHRFATGSDTEVLMAALAEWGPDALPRLIGMFAFVLIDSQTGQALAARDPFGVKPLYYCETPAGFAFASEPTPLLRLEGVEDRLNDQTVFDYLAYRAIDLGEDTFFGGIKRLEAGHSLAFKPGDAALPRPRRYWDPSPRAEAPLTLDQAAERYREAFLDSVRMQMRADVPLGVALSGGLDSSAIAAAARHLYPKIELQAFSYVADDPAISEERYVDALTEDLGLKTHKIRLSADDVDADLDHLIAIQGEPFSTSSVYAQYTVFRAARAQGVKVLLEGQGADEMLAGYPNFRGSRAASLLARGRLLGARNALAGEGRGAARTQLQQHILRTALGPRDGPGRGMIQRLTMARRRPAWMADGDAACNTAPPPAAPVSGRTLTAQLAQAVNGQPLQALLRYGDRNAMASSIENRVPFLTPGLFDLASSLPEAHILGPDGTTKRILRQALAGIVPDYIFERRDKIGFITPEARWLPPLVPRISAALPRIALPDFIDRARTLALISDTAAGNRTPSADIWRLVNLILWIDRRAGNRAT